MTKFQCSLKPKHIYIISVFVGWGENSIEIKQPKKVVIRDLLSCCWFCEDVTKKWPKKWLENPVKVTRVHLSITHGFENFNSRRAIVLVGLFVVWINLLPQQKSWKQRWKRPSHWKQRKQRHPIQFTTTKDIKILRWVQAAVSNTVKSMQMMYMNTGECFFQIDINDLFWKFPNRSRILVCIQTYIRAIVSIETHTKKACDFAKRTLETTPSQPSPFRSWMA